MKIELNKNLVVYSGNKKLPIAFFSIMTDEDFSCDRVDFTILCDFSRSEEIMENAFNRLHDIHNGDIIFKFFKHKEPFMKKTSAGDWIFDRRVFLPHDTEFLLTVFSKISLKRL